MLMITNVLLIPEGIRDEAFCHIHLRVKHGLIEGSSAAVVKSLEFSK